MSTVVDLRGRSLLRLADFTAEEITYLIDLAAELKAAKKDGTEEQKLVGKEIALIFEKDSTRTRCAFEVAAYDQGAHVTFMGPGGSHMGHKETAKDTARVLGRMYDAIEFRGFAQDVAEQLAEYSGVPVYNGLTDSGTRRRCSPTSSRSPSTATSRSPRSRSATWATPVQHGRQLPRRRGQAGHGRPRREPEVALADEGGQLALAQRGRVAETGANVHESRRTWPRPSKGVDFLLTDVWVSMGEPDDVWKERIDPPARYQMNSETMGLTGNPNVKVHALPAGVPQHGNAGRQGDLRQVRARLRSR